MLNKNKLLKEIRGFESSAALSSRLLELYDHEKAVQKLTKRPIGRMAYACLLAALILSLALASFSATYAGNYLLNVEPFHQALIAGATPLSHRIMIR